MIEPLNGFFQDYLEIARSRVVKDTSLVIAGNLINAGLAFTATILIARSLGPSLFGLFTVATAALMMAIQLSDLGTNTGIVKFAAKYLSERKESRASQVFCAALRFRLIGGVLISIIGLTFAQSIAVSIFHQPKLTFLLRLAFLGLLVAIIPELFSAILQSYKKFLKYIILVATSGGGRLVVVIALLAIHKLTLNNVMIGIILVPILSILVGTLFLPPKAFSERKVDPSVSKELFHFSKWITISLVCVLLMDNLDYYMLLGLKGAHSVGVYAAAWKLASIFPLIVGAMMTVLLPHVSEFSTKKRMKQYLVKVCRASIPLIALVALLAIPAPFLITIIFGQKYAASAQIFRVLLLAFSTSMLVNPAALVVYSLNKPQYFSAMNFVQLLIIIGGNLYLIPRIGAIGPAVSALFARILAIFFVSALLFYLLRREGDS